MSINHTRQLDSAPFTVYKPILVATRAVGPVKDIEANAVASLKGLENRVRLAGILTTFAWSGRADKFLLF